MSRFRSRDTLTLIDGLMPWVSEGAREDLKKIREDVVRLQHALVLCVDAGVRSRRSRRSMPAAATPALPNPRQPINARFRRVQKD